MTSASPSQLGLRQILMIEISICILIAAVVLCGSFADVKVWTDKARLIGYAGAASPHALTAIEHFDQTGSFTPEISFESSSDRAAGPPSTANSQQAGLDQQVTEQHYLARGDGFTVSTDAPGTSRPMTMDFVTHSADATGYTVMLSCTSRNLPLSVMREEHRSGDQDAFRACRDSAQ